MTAHYIPTVITRFHQWVSGNRQINAVILLWGILCQFWPHLLLADEAHVQESQVLTEQIDALVTPYVDLGMYNGVILVAQGKDVRFIKSYGKASYELDVELQTDSRFRIASLSKQFTNAAIGTLMDVGRIAPATALSKFVPEFPHADKIKVEHLINHSSGVVHTNSIAELKDVTSLSLDSMLDLLAGQGLAFDPGTQEQYSNGGYDLLAAIVERSSGLEFENYLQKAVLDPLGLTGTGRIHTYQVIPDLVQGYLPGSQPGERNLARFYPAEIRIGGGSLYSTAKDVFTLFRNTFQRSFAAETAPELLFWDTSNRYEITGRSPGFVAKVFIDIPNDITVVSLANNYSSLISWGRRLYQVSIGDPWETGKLKRVPHQVLIGKKGYFEGTYASEYDRGIISMDEQGGLQYFDEDNNWRVALIPTTENRWIHPFFDLICSFEGSQRAEAMVCQASVTRFEEATRFERKTTDVESNE